MPRNARAADSSAAADAPATAGQPTQAGHLEPGRGGSIAPGLPSPGTDDPYVFTWPVEVLVPGQGTHVKEAFTATFDAGVGLRQLPERDQDPDRDLLPHVLVGWDGIADEAGVELPFSPAARDRLLSSLRVRQALARAFNEGFEAVVGELWSRTGEAGIA